MISQPSETHKLGPTDRDANYTGPGMSGKARTLTLNLAAALPPALGAALIFTLTQLWGPSAYASQRSQSTKELLIQLLEPVSLVASSRLTPKFTQCPPISSPKSFYEQISTQLRGYLSPLPSRSTWATAEPGAGGEGEV